MRAFVDEIVMQLHGQLLTHDELTFVLTQLANSYDSYHRELLVMCAIRMRNHMYDEISPKTKLRMAKDWLDEIGVNQEELDELIVMAKLAQEDE